MPRWRTFSSDAPGQPPGAGPAGTPAAAPSRSLRQVAVIASLVAIGGAAAGASLVLGLVLVLTTATPQDGIGALVGEPLDGVLPALDGTEPSGDDMVVAGGSAFGAEIVVDVAGAVARPGLHRLEPGDRVGDAIEAAGGFGPRVDLAETSRSLNLAQPLQDGAKVLVPELGIDRVEAPSATDGKVDLNRASQAQLEELPGVGPVTARKILEARAEAPFAAVRELRDRGIMGQATFDGLRDLVAAFR